MERGKGGWKEGRKEGRKGRREAPSPPSTPLGSRTNTSKIFLFLDVTREHIEEVFSNSNLSQRQLELETKSLAVLRAIVSPRSVSRASCQAWESRRRGSRDAVCCKKLNRRKGQQVEILKDSSVFLLSYMILWRIL